MGIKRIIQNGVNALGYEVFRQLGIGNISMSVADEQHRGIDAPPKASALDFPARFREVISDPLNLLIERVSMAGVVEGSDVYLHNGVRVPIRGRGTYYGPFSEILVINRGVHEPLEEYVFQQLLRVLGDSPLMLELGAYWGHYSMWLKKTRPNSTVILVEPDANNLATGVNNFEKNGLSGEFVKSTVGRAHLQIDAFCNIRKLKRIDVLHVDIQGYELEMLEGCHESLAETRIDYLFISTHSQDIHVNTLKELNGHGYRVEVSSDFDNETTSFDGFIFASSPRAAKIFRFFNPLGRTKIAQSHACDLLTSISEIRLDT
jgi:hypothetical protein